MDHDGNPIMEVGGERAGRQRLVVCECKEEEFERRRAARLERIDNLTPQERSDYFENVLEHAHNREALAVVRRCLSLSPPHGIVSLWSPPGRGKSLLLRAAVNEARRAGISATYWTMAQVLQWLRASFNLEKSEQPDLTFEARWSLLTDGARVLALDEIEKVSPTDWVMEQVYALVDERYRRRRTHLTLFAANADLATLAPPLRSRLYSGDNWVFELGGIDARVLERRDA